MYLFDCDVMVRAGSFVLTLKKNYLNHRYLINNNCIFPLCDLLGAQDTRIITVALNGLENILRLGKLEMKETGINQYAILIEECKGEV